MNLLLSSNQHNLHQHITITGSKSESNRALLLQALYPNITIENLSNSDDSQVMKKGLQVYNGEVDIHHAGTAMRFLTAFFATQAERNVVLTGSQRMTERPIKILVDALRQLGAEIEYVKNEGYPPLKIKGKKITNNKVSLAANVSSQYISALLLVAPTLENGLELTLEGKITSVPYIKMTLALLTEIGVKSDFSGNVITVSPQKEVVDKTLIVESDWSSASYFYGISALCNVGSEISLSSYKATSLQGDSVLKELYEQFGVETIFNKTIVTLKKVREVSKDEVINFDLANAPDIAQTIAVTCFGLGLECELSGLHTLKIKETDRLEALKTELSKLGANISVTDKELFLQPSEEIKENVAIDTYNDHRMAMAFAPLALKVPIRINDAEVVSKSYPDFWKDMEALHFKVSEV
ncbi:3-phosphoshikimate 1-carboxyvinyltransferase [Joostella atrarenae]|uniref:3-phosphoshikimate 1-carboxyvinyltransferase n=1 Tax=Joostella atrarenae TaxID=679257 RepID=A0ABS9J6H4_9FLAO|nr:3-phosphoshikimate 1-carboxyvinyltransferase [Joostella atrarenae]MCF8716041.1 3-phosphoshikimate 1-carboxyvinyltransferase [Joostella atrarenae]